MKRKYTDEQLIEAVKNNISIRGVLKDLGIKPAGGSYKIFYKNIRRLDINTSHFLGKKHLKGKENLGHIKIPLSIILVKNSSFTNTNHLKKRLLKEKVITEKCTHCGIIDWRGEKLSLHLDHIDGDNTNNEISNLRLLCPNCHSLTPTYCGKNRKKL